MPQHSKELLEFLYRSPIALVTAHVDGTIQSMTPIACQWLMPLAKDGNMDNLFVLLESVAPLLELLVAERSSDVICDKMLIHVSEPNSTGRYLSLTVDHYSDGYLGAVFADVSSEMRKIQEAELESKFKSAFLANMSHEIRNPLNAITNMAYLLRKDGVTADQATKLDKLDQASKHLLAIISDILDLTKIGAGKLLLDIAPMKGDDIVSGVIAIAEERASAKNLHLEVDAEPLPDNLLGDITRIKQALANYVFNALKFTSAGRVIIHARIADETSKSVLLKFEVTDTGIGINEDALKRLFLTFEQADETTSRNFGGSGLGLAITKQLAQMMGGEVGAKSEPGVGSTFWFTVRLLKQKTPTVRELDDAVSGDQLIALLRTKCAGLRALVAEDEPINAEIHRVLLEDIGLTVDSVCDGHEALETARTSGYKIILLDMQMPTMGGLEATQHIRKLPHHETTPIVVVTANAFMDDRDRCLNSGVSRFVTKPVFPEKLYTAILGVV